MAADGGHVLVNEASLWPGGRFATAVLVVTSRFLSAHPAMVTALLKGQIQGTDLLNTDKTAAQAAAGTELTDLFSHSLPAPLLTTSFAQITFTDDPLTGWLWPGAGVGRNGRALVPGGVATPDDLLDRETAKAADSDGPMRPVLTRYRLPTVHRTIPRCFRSRRYRGCRHVATPRRFRLRPLPTGTVLGHRVPRSSMSSSVACQQHGLWRELCGLVTPGDS
jgi:hypothetical protein